MKNAFITILIILATISAKAQDVITTKKGEEATVNVTEVTQTEVKYRVYNNGTKPSDVIYSIPKSDVFMIKYKDGRKDIFNEEVKNQTENKSQPPLSGSTIVSTSTENKPQQTQMSTFKPNNNEMSLSDMGRADAKVYYRKYGGAKAGTLLTTGLIDPVVGLIPAIICSSTPPNEMNLDAPNFELMRQQEYHDAYKKEAYKIKKRKTWSGWGVGSAIWVFFVAMIISIGTSGG